MEAVSYIPEDSLVSVRHRETFKGTFGVRDGLLFLSMDVT